MAEHDNERETAKAASLVISIRAQGGSVRLGTVGKWRKAIQIGDLTPDTLVEVDLPNGETETRRAGDLDPLAPLFAAAGFQSPTEASPEPDGPLLETPPQPDEPSGPDVSPPAPVDPQPTTAGAPTPPPATEAAAATPPPGTESGGFPIKRLLAAGAVAILLFFVIRGCFGADSGKPAQAVAEIVHVYVRRDVMVLTVPGVANPATDKAFRGAALSGSWVTAGDGQTRWLHISDGAHRGGYAWGKNLSPTSPPPLIEVTAAETVLATGGVLHVEPSSASPVIDTVADGSTVWVVGRMDGWLEIGLKQGGVGYLARP